MRQYSIDRQNYHIFKTESGEKNPYVHFQWGKFDFRMTFKAGSIETVRKNPKKVFSAENGKQYLAKVFEVLFQGEWNMPTFVLELAHGSAWHAFSKVIALVHFLYKGTIL